jgi:hypothetical protein
MNSKLLIFISRILDYFILFFAGILLSLFSPVYIDLYVYLLFILALPLVWVPLEAFCLYRWKMTLGSFLLGIKLKEKMNYFSALKCALSWKGEHFFNFRSKIRFIPSLLVGLMAILGSFTASQIKGYWTNEDAYVVLEGWTHYRCPEGLFRINFPKEPLYDLKELNVSIGKKLMPYHDYTSYILENVAYSVSFVKLPAKWKFYSGHTILRAALDVIPENGPVSKITRSEKSFYRKYPSLNFHLKEGSDEVQGRLVFVNGTLFKLTVRAPADFTQEKHVEEFFNSFRF